MENDQRPPNYFLRVAEHPKQKLRRKIEVITSDTENAAPQLKHQNVFSSASNPDDTGVSGPTTKPSRKPQATGRTASSTRETNVALNAVIPSKDSQNLNIVSLRPSHINQGNHRNHEIGNAYRNSKTKTCETQTVGDFFIC